MPANDPVSLEDIVITGELLRRPSRQSQTRRERVALRSLSARLPQGQKTVLKFLSRLAVDLCDAGSAGVSVIEDHVTGEQVFRWHAMAGVCEAYEGGSSPRNWSPCGSCLDSGKPILYSHPARYFTYLQELGTPIIECLVIPLFREGRGIATIWIVSHEEGRKFDAEDARVTTSLGTLAVDALQSDPLPTVTGRSGMAGGHGTEAIDVAGPAQSRDQRESTWGEYVRRIGAGDHTALASLFDESGPLLFTTALRIIGFHADAEDVIAEVFADVWRTAHNWDPKRGTAASWLITMARSRAIDRRRMRGSRGRSEEASAAQSRIEATAESDLVASERRHGLLLALNALPIEQREAIELAYFSGLTAAEIAERLGRPVGTIKTRIRTGLIRLRRLLVTL